MKNELKTLLLKKCETRGTELNIEDTGNIFVHSENQFKLMRGDQLLLPEIADYLNIIFISNGKDALVDLFNAPKRFKIGKSDTDNFSSGLFYGKRRRQRLNKAQLDKVELSKQLFLKIRQFLESFPKLNPVCAITEDILKIVDLGDSGIRGDIICVFCELNVFENKSLIKRHAIQCDKFGYWNLSNLRKHVTKKHTQIKVKEEFSAVKITKTSKSQSKANFVNETEVQYSNVSSNQNESLNHSVPDRIPIGPYSKKTSQLLFPMKLPCPKKISYRRL